MIKTIISHEAEAAGISAAIRDKAIAAVYRRNRGRAVKEGIVYRQELIHEAEKAGGMK